MAFVLFLKPIQSFAREHLEKFIKVVQLYSNNYGYFILMGDYDAQVPETNMASFCKKI